MSIRSKLDQKLLYINWLPNRNSVKLYDINQAKIKRVLADIITPQDININVLITDLHEFYLRKTFETVYTGSNMQLSDLNSKPHGGKILRYFIYRDIGVRFYTPPGPKHYKHP